jgi:DNA-binding beta-propeller fold protein YncE
MALAVIDCRSDSVVRTIPIPVEAIQGKMCHVSSACYDKLYVGAYPGDLCIIDCIRDTLIRSYSFGWSQVVAGHEGKRVYCWRMRSLCTFDPAGDTLVAEAPWLATSGFDLLYAPDVNKVYCACPGGENYVLVADGTTDSVIAQIPLRMPSSFGYDSASKLVYVSCGLADDSMITFLDSRTDSVVGSLSPHVCPTAFTMVAAHHRVYVGSAQGSGSSPDYSAMPVIRTDPPGVEEAAQSFTSKKPAVPTIVSRNSPLVVHQQSVMLDAAGRKVLELLPGPNYVRGLAPGVYFVREKLQAPSSKRQTVHKVIVTR